MASTDPLDLAFARFRDHAEGAALAAVFDATAADLYAVARHLVRDAALAEDLVQQTFVIAIARAARYDGSSPVRGWLYGILWREAAKARRAAARSLDPARLAPRPSIEPLAELAQGEVPQVVERTLERMSPRDREVLEPFLHEERRPEEIARALGRSAGTVRSQIHRALARLRAGLPAGLAAAPGLAGLPLADLARLRSEVLRAAEGAAHGAPALEGAAGASAAKSGAAGASAAKSGAASLSSVSSGSTAGTSATSAATGGVGAGLTAAPGAAGTVSGLSSHAAAAGAGWLQQLVASVAASKALIAAGAAAAVLAGGTWTLLQRDSGPAPSGGPVAPLVRAPSSDAQGAPLPLASTAAPTSSTEVESARAGATPPPSAALSAATFEEQVAHWLARFGEDPESWRHGWSVAAQIAQLPPDEALAVMEAVWPHLSVPVKEQALKPFVLDGGHPHALAVLDLAARDASLSVQGRALHYLQSYAFQDFASDYAAYLRWSDEQRGRPLADVLTSSARRFIGELLAAGPAELAERVASLHALDLATAKPLGLDLAAQMRAAGAEQALERCLAHGDDDLRARALEWSRTLEASEPWLRANALPALEPGAQVPPNVLGASLAALGRPDQAWAREPLVAYLGRALREGAAGPEMPEWAGTKEAARALAEIGEPAAIPALIGLLARHDTKAAAYDLGHFGLSKLTGVTWHEHQDAAWWLAWWDKNRARLPPEVAATPIPR